MTTPPFNGGLACPGDDILVYNCPHSKMEVDWDYRVPEDTWTSAKSTAITQPREMPMIVCPFGSQLSFKWGGTKKPGNRSHLVHDVMKLKSEEAYNSCDFSKAASVSYASSSSTFDFPCDSVGVHYFACSVDDACVSGKQKVRVYVSDPARTAKMRAKGGMSLEQFNRKYTIVFAGYYLNAEVLPENNAAQAMLDAQEVLAKSPESCADWIPPSWNSNQSCSAFIYTDLGFLSRVRPDPDFAASEYYYNMALQISPGMCGATAYMAELKVQQNNKTGADEYYLAACTACGQTSMDFTALVISYENRSWTPPDCARAPAAIAAKQAEIANVLRRPSTTMYPVAGGGTSGASSLFSGFTATLLLLLCSHALARANSVL